MSETGRDLPLDGNAAGGLLMEIFRFEPTVAVVTCDGCGATGPIAELMCYGHGMGTILRCSGCDHVVVRVSYVGDGYCLDLRGARMVRFVAPP